MAESETSKSALKHYTMWAHFDSLVSRLNNDEIEDLNFEIMSVIRVALKKKRESVN